MVATSDVILPATAVPLELTYFETKGAMKASVRYTSTYGAYIEWTASTKSLGIDSRGLSDAEAHKVSFETETPVLKPGAKS